LLTIAEALKSFLLQTLNEARRVINALKILRYLSSEQTAEEEASTAQDYLERYFSALALGSYSITRAWYREAGTDQPHFRSEQAKTYHQLSFNRRMISLFSRLKLSFQLGSYLVCPLWSSFPQTILADYIWTDDRSYLERAAALLDYALRSSKYKYQSRILLINLYRLLGASSLSLSHYRIFGVKNVQYDTLSHLILNRGATFAIEAGKETGVHEEATVTDRWYKMGTNEAAQMCVQTFTMPNYGKVNRFFHLSSPSIYCSCSSDHRWKTLPSSDQDWTTRYKRACRQSKSSELDCYEASSRHHRLIKPSMTWEPSSLPPLRCTIIEITRPCQTSNEEGVRRYGIKLLSDVEPMWAIIVSPCLMQLLMFREYSLIGWERSPRSTLVSLLLRTLCYQRRKRPLL